MPLIEPVNFYSVSIDKDRNRTKKPVGTIGATIVNVVKNEDDLSDIELSETRVRLKVAWTPTTETIVDTADEFTFRDNDYKMTVAERINNRSVMIEGERSSA